MASYATPPPAPSSAPTRARPFTVSIPAREIAAFKQLLSLSRVAKETYENGARPDRRWGLGRQWMLDAKEVWLGEFDWRKTESYINSFPNFTTSVTTEAGDFTTHFIALFSSSPSAIPLLLLHGWPGNFLEFLPILNLLRAKYPDPAVLPYHVIVPSLPGYAWSSPPPLGRDFAVPDVAVVMDRLMQNLGFGSGYVAQGGDIGSRVVKILGGDAFSSCKAVHVNFDFFASPPPGFSEDEHAFSEKEKAMIAKGRQFLATGSAYAAEHGTRPATIGLVLASNPLALLAWIGEKYREWTDEDPSLQQILESVSLYWFTQTIESSIYTYRTRFLPEDQQPVTEYIKVPFGFSSFPKELIPVPKVWAQTQGNLVFYREHSKGGHFAALEQPDVLLGDIEEFVKQVWTA